MWQNKLDTKQLCVWSNGRRGTTAERLSPDAGRSHEPPQRPVEHDGVALLEQAVMPSGGGNP